MKVVLSGVVFSISSFLDDGVDGVVLKLKIQERVVTVAGDIGEMLGGFALGDHVTCTLETGLPHPLKVCGLGGLGRYSSRTLQLKDSVTADRFKIGPLSELEIEDFHFGEPVALRIEKTPESTRSDGEPAQHQPFSDSAIRTS